MFDFSLPSWTILAFDATLAPGATPPPAAAACRTVTCSLIEPVFWIVFLAFNLAAIVQLMVTSKAIDIKSALTEKSLTSSSPPPSGNGTAPPPAGDVPQSASRAIGALGGMVIVAFFWACCNVAVYWALANPANLTQFAQGVWPLFLAGSALFLPYAFNQLKGAFTS